MVKSPLPSSPRRVRGTIKRGERERPIIVINLRRMLVREVSRVKRYQFQHLLHLANESDL